MDMQPRSRSLPDADLAALHGVIVTLEGELLGDALPPDLTQRLLRRLTEHGPLAEGSTPGSTYHLVIPFGSVTACITALRAAGAANIADGPPTTQGWDMRPTGPDGALERHSIYPADGREITAAFPELAPDPAYHERVTQLSALAERHGGQYTGASW